MRGISAQKNWFSLFPPDFYVLIFFGPVHPLAMRNWTPRLRAVKFVSVSMLGIIGYSAGMLSYRGQCEERMMSLNTPLAKWIREQKMRAPPSQAGEYTDPPDSKHSMPQDQSGAEFGSRSSGGLNEAESRQPRLRERDSAEFGTYSSGSLEARSRQPLRPRERDTAEPNVMPPPAAFGEPTSSQEEPQDSRTTSEGKLTYAEIRRRHREEAVSSGQGRSWDDVARRRRLPPSSSNEGSPPGTVEKGQRYNQYGDPIHDED